MHKTLIPALCLACAVSLPGCDRDKAAARQKAPTVIFRSKDGRTLTLDELQGATGEFQYEILGRGSIPAEAEALHRQARAAGGRGDYERAVELLARSSEIAPQWAYPVYDTAYTYLLMRDFDAAREHYRKTVEMEPRGFFTAITALHTLVREQQGDLPVGTYLEHLSLEWMDDPAQREERVRRLVEALPRFAPAWKELAMLLDDDSARLAAIERGLAANPDAETRGMLEINRALVLDGQGERDEAVRILGELALDAESTYATQHLARAVLAQLVAK